MFKVVLLLITLMFCSGCLLTKLVTVPMRVVGAGVSVIPMLGNPIHDGIDEAAAVIDKVPI